MQIGDNYLNDGHLPPERSQIDGQSATECRHAFHHTQITSIHVTTVASDTWLLWCPSRRHPRGDHPHHRLPRRSAVWVVVHGGWCGSDFNVVACCLLFFYTIDISDLPMFYHTPMFLIFDVRCVHWLNSS